MLSQREAAQRWHTSRAAIQRAIKAGKLSLTPDKTIDPAEMVRVFGEPSRAPSRPTEPHEATPRATRDEAKIAELEAEIVRLRQFEIERAALAATVAAQAANLADLRAQVLQLTHEPAPASGRKRWFWQRD